MKVFGGRRFALFAFVFIIVSFLCAFVPAFLRNYAILVALSLGVLTLVFGIVSRAVHMFRTREVSDSFIIVSIVLISAALAMLLCAFTIDRRVETARRLDGKSANIVCSVTDTVSADVYYSYYNVKITEIDGEKASIGARAEFSTDMGLEYGDVLEGEFEISRPKENLYGYPLRDAYVADGIYLVIVSDGTDVSVSESAGNGFFGMIRMMSEKLRDIMSDIFDGRDGGINSALILGDKSELDSAFSRDVRRLGLSHILALSGMHLTIIIGGAEKFLSLLRVPKRARYITVIPLVLLYAALTGFPSSVLRAGIMLIVYYLAFLIGRTYDSVSALFFALMLIITVSPESARDVGLILSFLATLSIVAVSAGVMNRFNATLENWHVPRVFSAAIGSVVFMAVSGFFAITFSLPVMWLFFSEASVVGIFLNLIISPLASVIMFLGVLSLAFCGLPFMCGLLADIDVLVCRAVTEICSFFSSMRGITVSLKFPFTGIIFTVMFALIALILIFSIKRKIIYTFTVCAVSVAVFAGCVWVYTDDYYESDHISYVTYKNSEAINVVSGGKTLIIDFSNGGYNIIRQSLYSLESMYSTEIEAYMITHYHRLHTASFDKLSKNEIVRSLLLPQPQTEDDKSVYFSLVEIAESAGCEVYVYELGEDGGLIFEDVKLTLTRGKVSRSTHPTLALGIVGDNGGMYYMSASFWESDPELTEEISKKGYAVLKGLHGPVVKVEPSIPFLSLEPNEKGIYEMIIP